MLSDGLDILNQVKHINGILASMLDSSAEDRVFEPRSDQIKAYEIGICSIQE